MPSQGFTRREAARGGHLRNFGQLRQIKFNDARTSECKLAQRFFESGGHMAIHAIGQIGTARQAEGQALHRRRGRGCGRFLTRHEAINQRTIRNCPRQRPCGIKRR